MHIKKRGIPLLIFVFLFLSVKTYLFFVSKIPYILALRYISCKSMTYFLPGTLEISSIPEVHFPVHLHCWNVHVPQCTILCATVDVNNIIRSGCPICVFKFPDILVNTFALHLCFLQICLYCCSILSLPPIITTLI